MSQMIRNITRLTDTVSVTYEQGYEYVILYFICHN